MPAKEAVHTTNAPPPMPFFSQAIKCQGLVYCSGSLGVDPKTEKMVEGSVSERTVCFTSSFFLSPSLHLSTSYRFLPLTPAPSSKAEEEPPREGDAG